MTELLVQIQKHADGSAVLKCVRSDGSATWQKQVGKQAMFFPLHDLTHFAVETVLGFRSGFYGLVADGWDIEDTEGKGQRGSLPPEAITVEKLVGSLDAERAGGSIWSAEDFNSQALDFARSNGLPDPPQWTEDDLARVRARVRELFGHWFALGSGNTLELEFSRSESH